MEPSISRASRPRRSRPPIKSYHDKISKSSIKRLARRGGVRRISDLIYEEINEMLNAYLTRLIEGAFAYCKYFNRKTIIANDVVRAMKSYGQRLYGFDDPPLPKSVGRTAVVITDTVSVTTESTEAFALKNTERAFEQDEMPSNEETTELSDESVLRSSENCATTGSIISNAVSNAENRDRMIQNSGRNEENIPIIGNSTVIIDAGSTISNPESNVDEGKSTTQNSRGNEENIPITANSVDIIGITISNSESNAEDGEKAVQNSCGNEENIAVIRNSASSRVAENNVEDRVRIIRNLAWNEKSIPITRKSEDHGDTISLILNSENNVENRRRNQNLGWNQENIQIIRSLANTAEARSTNLKSESDIENRESTVENYGRNEENIIVIRNSEKMERNREIMENSGRNDEIIEIMVLPQNSVAENTGNPEIVQNSITNTARSIMGSATGLDRGEKRIERTATPSVESSQSSLSLDGAEIINALTFLNDARQIPLITLDDSD